MTIFRNSHTISFKKHVSAQLQAFLDEIKRKTGTISSALERVKNVIEDDSIVIDMKKPTKTQSILAAIGLTIFLTLLFTTLFTLIGFSRPMVSWAQDLPKKNAGKHKSTAARKKYLQEQKAEVRRRLDEHLRGKYGIQNKYPQPPKINLRNPGRIGIIDAQHMPEYMDVMHPRKFDMSAVYAIAAVKHFVPKRLLYGSLAISAVASAVTAALICEYVVPKYDAWKNKKD